MKIKRFIKPPTTEERARVEAFMKRLPSISTKGLPTLREEVDRIKRSQWFPTLQVIARVESMAFVASVDVDADGEVDADV